MMVFADSSAVVKLYADEEGHDQIRGLDTLIVSQVARVEVPSALWRKARLGEIDPSAAGVLAAAFAADWSGGPGTDPRFPVVALTAELAEAAGRLTGVHGLRAYDAVQLASALAARASTGATTLAAFDRGLRAAATTEGLALLPA